VNWSELAAKYAFELTIASVLAFVAGLVAMRFAVIYMPADYFTRRQSLNAHWSHRYPALRWIWLISKNTIGVALLLIGLTMLVIPGPGVMVILLGLSLVNMPGKRRLECWLINFPRVRTKIDKMRVQHNQPPLEMPTGDRENEK
jgi:hypothetical protein